MGAFSIGKEDILGASNFPLQILAVLLLTYIIAICLYY